MCLSFWSKTSAVAVLSSLFVRDELEYFEMERVAHKSRNFSEADEWDGCQHVGMSPRERMEAAQKLKRRLYPKDSPDIRECREVTKTKR